MSTKLLQVYVPAEVFQEIELIARGFSTRSGAVQHLIKLGLQEAKKGASK
jgi:metal-responsive CopG/Arc/MetJ family transcriptional regulator